ncbi:DnaB-like helicase C-terminal domain-containing protein [Thermophilibacter sp.]
MSAEWRRFASRFGSLAADEAGFLDPPRVVPTGISGLDAVLVDGMAPGVHVLMAKPGAGKSALALQIALNVATAGGNVLYASLEMGRQQCLARLCSALSVSDPDVPDFYWSGWERLGRLASRDVAKYRFTDDMERRDYASRFDQVRALRHLSRRCPGLAIADGPEVSSVESLAATVGDGVASGLDLLVVDYLQRLRPPEDSRQADRYRQVSDVSAALTSMTKTLRVPALVISSMNREAMGRDGPSMGGARGSGEIEYDAVTMWQLSRGREQPLEDDSRIIELHVLKNRRGPVTGDSDPIRLLFDGKHNRVVEAA